jgi:Bacterial membrane protein YfhO
MSIGRRIVPYAVLASVALAYFAPLVVHPSRTLYGDHSDLIALHVPWMTFLARSWQIDGELPLWNPLQFAGLPFAHDVQAAISYPPHAIFRWVGDGNVGSALSWLIVAHVVWAGCGMFLYSRATGLGRAPSIVAAVGFMLAGKWMLHLLLAGHYAFAGLAWLPWTLLGLHVALERRSLVAASWAGVAFGMLALGTHPQLTLYGGIFAAIWTLPFALDQCPQFLPRFTPHGWGVNPEASPATFSSRLIPWLILGLWAALIAGGIAAAQLAPSLEASRLASRGISGVPEGGGLSIRALLAALGPSPSGVKPVESWEPRSGVGVIWLAVAAAAPLLTIGRNRRRAWWAVAITLGLAGFALGGAGLFRWVPFFKMFRMPARMFLVIGLPVAYLAGLATQGLLDRPGLEIQASARRLTVRVAVISLAWLAIAALAAGIGGLRMHLYWISLIATVPALVWLVGTDPARSPRRWLVLWSAVLVIDLVAQTRPHLKTCDLVDVLAPSAVARDVAWQAGPHDRVLDRNIPGHQSSTPLGPAVAARLGLETVRGYNPLDLVGFKDYLALVSDPVPVRNPYNGLINAYIKHKSLLDLLGVRFLVQPAEASLRSLPGETEPGGDASWRRVGFDPAPVAFTFAVGGVRRLPGYEVLENRDAFPRAFVVPRVEPLPKDRAGIVRAMTTADFRRVALVESAGLLDVGDGAGVFRAARVVSYHPNRVELEADGPGLLVLADPDYPGWTATIDGAPATIVRADGLFRGVPLAEGRHAVAFAFRPRSYLVGRAVSLGTLAVVGLVTACSFIGRRRRRDIDGASGERRGHLYAMLGGRRSPGSTRMVRRGSTSSQHAAPAR